MRIRTNSIILSMLRPSVSYVNLLFFTMLVFAIGDLYFAYTDLSCTHAWITNTKLGFGLGTWLKVSGYTNILFLLFPVLSFFLANCSQTLLLVYMVFAALYVFFRFIWLVIGAIMFWGYLSSTHLCSRGLHIYMWINLIYSFFILFFLCYNQQQVYTTTYATRRVYV